MILTNGLENEQVIAVYNHVVECGKYDNVLRYAQISYSTFFGLLLTHIQAIYFMVNRFSLDEIGSVCLVISIAIMRL